MHCKAFRRLKHKTQVFVAPEGDHYRTRLTHTLETTQISRTVARALRLNEDLTEAIGLGHDLGHPPFGHIGEDVLDRAGRERFGRGFRHNEHSLRVVDVLERPQPHGPVRDGILRHSSGAGEPATLEGKIVRLVDRIAYINHDIDDALRAGVLALGDLPGEEIAILGDTGSQRIDTLVHDLVEHSARAGDIVQGETVGPAMLRLRTFMFERVYLGPTARAEHAKIERVLRGLFDWYASTPSELPDGGRGRVGGRPRDRLPRRHDRPLRHPRLAGPLRPAGPGGLMARYTDDSRERVRDAVDFVELVGARTELKPAGPRRMTGLCPFHDERTPSFGIDPVEKLYHCFGCGAGGDVFKFAMETEGLDFAGALEALAERAGIELEREAEDPREAERRGRRDRLLALLERTAAYYVRVLWESAEAAPARAVSGRARAGGGRAARVPRRLLAERMGRVIAASRKAGYRRGRAAGGGACARAGATAAA